MLRCLKMDLLVSKDTLGFPHKYNKHPHSCTSITTGFVFYSTAGGGVSCDCTALVQSHANAHAGTL